MSRQRVALLFVLYFIVSVAIPVIIVAFAMPSEVSISRMTPLIGAAIELGIKIYFLSGVLPFAVWGARGFKAANARSLFIPWAILILLAFVMPIDHWLVCTLTKTKPPVAPWLAAFDGSWLGPEKACFPESRKVAHRFARGMANRARAEFWRFHP